MKKILAAIAFVTAFFSIVIVLRQPIGLFILIPVIIFPIHYSNYFGKEFSLIFIIIGCFGSLFFINGLVPLWGERYINQKNIDEMNAKVKDERYKNLNTITSSQDVVKDSLKDPSSASFKNNFVSDKSYVCGQVNAKNSFGSYAGYKRYINRGGLTLIDDDSPEFSRLWDENCNH